MMMPDKHSKVPPDSIHIGMVVFITVAYWLVLQLIGGTILTTLWRNYQQVDSTMGQWGAAIPWPLLVLLFPVVVFLLLALFAPRDDHDLVPHHRQGPSSVIQTDRGGASWFQAWYTRHRLWMLMKIISLVWVVLFLTQLMFWFGFRSYRM